MQIGASGEIFQLFLRASDRASNLKRIAANTPGVACCFAVAEINRRPERLQGAFVIVLELAESVMKPASAFYNHFFEMLTVVLDLQFQLPLVEGTLQAYADRTFPKRFDEVVVRAAAHGLHADLEVVNTGGDQERHVRVRAAYLGEQFQTADSGHLKVGDNRIESLALQSHKGFFAAGGGRAVKSC